MSDSYCDVCGKSKGIYDVHCPPRTLRDDFALAAITGILTEGTPEPWMIPNAYEIADHLLRERKQWLK